MSRYIDADKLMLHLNDYKLQVSPNWKDEWERMVSCLVIDTCMDAVQEQPTADVRKNVKAKKVLAGGILDGTTHWYECSCCHGAVDILDAYCKHCGAVLELENDL